MLHSYVAKFSSLEVYIGEYLFLFLHLFATPNEWDECEQGLGMVDL
jgi:hypothetical protein